MQFRFCRIHEPRNAVDIDNATAGLKTVLDNLADMNVLLHDGPSQLSELDRVWQVPMRDPKECGFYLELIRSANKRGAK